MPIAIETMLKHYKKVPFYAERRLGQLKRRRAELKEEYKYAKIRKDTEKMEQIATEGKQIKKYIEILES